MDEYAHLQLLGMFDTPVLNSLAITTPGEGQETHLSKFLQRCGGQLQRMMLLLSVGENSFRGFVGFTQHTPMLETLCTAYRSGLGLVDLATSPALSQIDIITGYGEYTMAAVLPVLSQWKASRLKESAISVSPFYHQGQTGLSIADAEASGGEEVHPERLAC
ncbi:hypothetical protein BD410DRAFT_286236 [Rickenella mellea]|uniref:Uncharacterized protein n=1 Tax=Rickenella mellea TaxID=50990 RepID=A0A4Y7Q2H4_9AGAM|nr:hypothetical protein BD410DRAFT_286236 [Rickenella mellea]